MYDISTMFFITWKNITNFIEDPHTNLLHLPHFNSNLIQTQTSMHLKLKSMNTYMFAGPNGRANNKKRQHSGINVKNDSEHKIAYILSNIGILTSCTTKSKVRHHSRRPISTLCIPKIN